MLLAACATKPQIEATDTQRYGVAQAREGHFVVCRECPGPTPKTLYRAAEGTTHRAPKVAERVEPNKVISQRDHASAAPALTLHFAYDEHTLSAAGKQSIRRLASEVAGRNISVKGYTDDIGPQAYNNALALRRAESVARVLAESGIPRERIAVSGQGKCCYVASNENAEGRALNRRAEIFLTSPNHKEPTP